MNADLFYQQVVDTFRLPPSERYTQMVQLHTQVMNEYVVAVQRITVEAAAQSVSTDGDQRTLAQIVAHIAAWERFGILAAGDMLAGVQHPRSITDVKGYVEEDGRVLDFADVHAFNNYQTQKYQTWSWSPLQTLAIDTATTFYTLFTHPQLLTATRLEQTKPYRKHFRNGQVIQNVRMGWCLWAMYLDHEGVEHAAELQLP